MVLFWPVMTNSASPAQFAANRANSKLSTGPKTEEGKEISSQNRRTYGFNGGFVLLADEDVDQYHDLVGDLMKAHQPANEMERLLVIKLVQHHWLVQRALSYQTGAFDHEMVSGLERQLALFLRYQGQHERAFNKTLAQLQQMQKERKAEDDSLRAAKLQALAMDAEYKFKRSELLELRTIQLRNKITKQDNSSTSSEIGFEPQNPASQQKITPLEQPAAA